MLFSHLADDFPFTGYEPKTCIDLSSEHTPINFSSKRDSFNIENNDFTTTVAASENSDGFNRQAAASGSPQPVPASVVNPWLGADMWSSTRKLVRGDESISSFERTLSRGERYRDLESAQTLNGEIIMSTMSRKLNQLFKESAQLRRGYLRLKQTRNWEQRRSDIALHETNRELESQRFQLQQASRWADQTEKR